VALRIYPVVYNALMNDRMSDELWRTDPPRILTDAAAARVLAMSPANMPHLRKYGWLPKRKAVRSGSYGTRGFPRYSLLEAVAADVAKTSKQEFGWKPKELRRVVQIIQSGDRELVRNTTVATLTGNTPGTVCVLLFAPEHNAMLQAARDKGDVLQETSLLEIVEHLANIIFKKLVKAGIEFTGSPVGGQASGNN